MVTHKTVCTQNDRQSTYISNDRASILVKARRYLFVLQDRATNLYMLRENNRRIWVSNVRDASRFKSVTEAIGYGYNIAQYNINLVRE